jgi:hypothetical protein
MDDTILEDLLDQSRRYAGDEPTAALRKASGAFLSRADSDSNILVAAANALAALPPVGAAEGNSHHQRLARDALMAATPAVENLG